MVMGLCNRVGMEWQWGGGGVVMGLCNRVVI